jgi:hypothetical protein
MEAKDVCNRFRRKVEYGNGAHRSVYKFLTATCTVVELESCRSSRASANGAKIGKWKRICSNLFQTFQITLDSVVFKNTAF